MQKNAIVHLIGPPDIKLSRSPSRELQVSPANSRGVRRIPLALHNASESEADLNALIIAQVAVLAQEGKRVYGIPKRLQDGIALDWVLDNSVKTEDVRAILDKMYELAFVLLVNVS
ncbi:hypothetical protein BC835DRAFT_38829 [Cytidiella melzeri]|nr:hypothetical protein BC835DRAFT_38829 [Cytidiella melzeri]